MANDVNRNPKVVDTFTSDVTVAGAGDRVQAIAVEAGATDIALFNDNDGNHALRLTCTAAGTNLFAWANAVYFPKGLVLASGTSTLIAGDFVYVFGV